MVTGKIACWPEVAVGLASYLLFLVLISVVLLQIPDEQAAVRGIVGMATNGVAGSLALLAAILLRIRDFRPFGFRAVNARWLLVGAVLGIVAVGLSFIIEYVYFLFFTEANTQADFHAAAKAGPIFYPEQFSPVQVIVVPSHSCSFGPAHDEVATAIHGVCGFRVNQGWDMKNLWKLSVAAIGVATLAGCNSSSGVANLPPAAPGAPAAPATPAGTLPVKTNGKMIAVRLPANVTSKVDTFDNLPYQSAEVTSAVSKDRTAAGGVGISGEADKDPSPNKNQGSDIAPAALISAKADGKMKGGTAFIGLDKVKGAVYFDNGNFGDPQASSADAAISSVGVYNHYDANNNMTQTILKDSTTIRYRDGKDGDTEATFGVGYVGNATAAMPGSGEATYKGFFEQGIGVYNKDGVATAMGLQGDAELKVNFGTGSVTGGVKGSLNSYENGKTTNLNQDIKGMAINAKIKGSEYTGTANLVDGNGKAVGTVANGEAIGGFFGANAAETIAATSIEGKAKLGGVDSDYVLQGVIGAVKK